MLGSFMVLCIFIYIFHIVQAAVFYRTYFTASSLLILGLGLKLTKEKNTKLLWECSFIWFVYSLVFFDIRTHIQNGHWVIIAFYAMFPVFAYMKLYQKPYGIYFRICFSVFVTITPTLFSNVYGNALYSIVKLLCVVLLIITNDEGNLSIEHFIWPMFAHPIILTCVPVQVAFNVMRIIKPTKNAMPARTKEEKKTKNDIIGSNDVPFLFKHSV